MDLRAIAAALLAALLTPSAGAADVVPEALPGAPAFAEALRARLVRAVERSGEAPRTRHVDAEGRPTYTNRLALESSPYLRQHAHNPVNWFPWGDEAFAAAKALGRPVLVSIGYSTCHWCHVMEEESFDDVETAEQLNRQFIAIKVDREVRPDVDALYMTALQAMGQSGGWPLNVWVTPDRKPFFGGTYFPPRDRPGRPGFRRVLGAVHALWSEDPERVEGQAEALSRALAAALEGEPALATRAPDPDWLRARVDAWWDVFDPRWGGTLGSPKFPSGLPVRLLLRLHRRGGDPRALEMATVTLEKIAAGGIHDAIGGGFHRYAVDARWRVPHFEKMLYDNALLAMAYVEGWQATGREAFARVARRTLAYVAREMTRADGGFYSATDADSPTPEGEREEGRFFTWTPAELEAALGPDDAALAADWYDVDAEGDLDGRNVLHTGKPPAEVAARHGIAPDALDARLARIRARLLAARAQRPPPLRDEKVLVGWNGLMISAFARAGLAFDDAGYVERATRAAEVALATRRDGRLHRVATAAGGEGPAFLEDYAFLIQGLLDLYEAAPAPRWIREALALQAVLDARHRDAEGGGYHRVAADGERLLAREKPVQDGAMPSGNAVAALNLLRLAAFTGDERHRERALETFSAFHAVLADDPRSASALAIALDFALDTPKEVLVVKPAGDDAEALLRVLRRAFLPNRVVSVVREGAELEEHAQVVPLLAYKKARDGRSTAYVCENRTCRFPTSDPDTFRSQLARVRSLEPEKD